MQSFVAGWSVRLIGERASVILGMAINTVGFACFGLAATQLKTEFWPLVKQTTPFDSVTVDLKNHTVNATKA